MAKGCHAKGNSVAEIQQLLAASCATEYRYVQMEMTNEYRYRYR